MTSRISPVDCRRGAVQAERSSLLQRRSEMTHVRQAMVVLFRGGVVRDRLRGRRLRQQQRGRRSRRSARQSDGAGTFGNTEAGGLFGGDDGGAPALLSRRWARLLRAAGMHHEPERDGLRPGGPQPALQRRGLRAQRSRRRSAAHHAGDALVQHVRRVDRRLRRRDHDRLSRKLHADRGAGDFAPAARRADGQVAARGFLPHATACANTPVAAANSRLPRITPKATCPRWRCSPAAATTWAAS